LAVAWALSWSVGPRPSKSKYKPKGTFRLLQTKGHTGCFVFVVTLKNNKRVVFYACAAAMIFSLSEKLCAGERISEQNQMHELQNQHKALQKQLKQQRALIDSLSQKVNQIQQAEDMRKGQTSYSNSEPKDDPENSKSSFSPGRISLTAEGGIAFFNTGSEAKS
jgi:hypothetical protein